MSRPGGRREPQTEHIYKATLQTRATRAVWRTKDGETNATYSSGLYRAITKEQQDSHVAMVLATLLCLWR